MKTTSGVVSTVCYASKPFVTARLQQLTENKALTFWALVEHPEYVKTTTGELRKRHVHVIMEAGQERINLDSVSKFLEEPDPDPNQPHLGCLPFRRSQLADWLPYSVHDRDYLRYKHLEKPYYDIPLSEVVTSDKEQIELTWENEPRHKWKSAIDKLVEAYASGMSAYDFCRQENVPLAMIGTVLKTYREYASAMRLESDIRMVASHEEREDTQ